MGFWHSTYHFFGIHVPQDKYQTTSQQQETEWLDAVIKNTPGLSGTGLGYVTAGDYDRDELFLCVRPNGESTEVKLGNFAQVTRESHRPEWHQLLLKFAEAAGYEGLDEPAYIVVPDVS